VFAEWPNPKRIALGVHDPTYLAVSQNGRFLYAAEDDPTDGRVTAFAIDPASGQLTILSTRHAGKSRACYLSIDHTGRNLLVASFGGSLAVLPIDQKSGDLGDATTLLDIPGTRVGSRGEPHPHWLNASPDNRFAIATDLGRDRIMVYRFDAERGLLT